MVAEDGDAEACDHGMLSSEDVFKTLDQFVRTSSLGELETRLGMYAVSVYARSHFSLLSLV